VPLLPAFDELVLFRSAAHNLPTVGGGLGILGTESESLPMFMDDGGLAGVLDARRLDGGETLPEEVS
jgi:hypothetical protein